MPADQQNIVDTSVKVHGYAMTSATSPFVPYEYHPRVLGEDEVEVSITHCGICASDIHTATGGWGHCTYPIIVGHEIVGHVTKVGANVTQFKQGDRVGVGAQAGACCDFGKHCRGCDSEQPNHCSNIIGTYSGVYPDGERSQGGYADLKRLNQRFVFHIPDNMTSESAAPLLCAGVTVYAPLKRYNASKGKRVAIIGIGGLGHLAVQFSHKMGAETVAFGTSLAKKDLAMKLGATDYVNIKDADQMKQHEGTYDLIICTADVKGQSWDQYIRLGKFDAQFVTVALPDEPISLGGWNICVARVNFTGSAIGSPNEIREMLQFAAKNDVRPMVEVLPLTTEGVNQGIKKVQTNDVKFRVVLEQRK